MDTDFRFRWQGDWVEVRVRNFNIFCRFLMHGEDAKWEGTPLAFTDKAQAVRDIKQYFE
jgi:hypothetical protein